MIIGNGLIASAFLKDGPSQQDVIIFASGVSNSNETSIQEFNREEQLLAQTLSKNRKAMIVYFSTCTISMNGFQNVSPYLRHKRKMERHVQDHQKYLIVRLPNVIGEHGNPTNLLNLLIRKIEANEKIKIWRPATRNIIDVTDVVMIVKKLLENNVENQIVRVAGIINYSVEEIVNEIAHLTQLNPRMEMAEIMSNRDVYPSEVVLKIIRELNLHMGKGYLGRILEKYYGADSQ